jgi:para-aminobenzoate synthetase component 2
VILVIDNYDSFVHNLARYIRELGRETHVVRNDEINVEDVTGDRYEAVVLSPGPCTPAEAGLSVPLLRRLPENLPVLGVCLGHQAIVAAYGGRLDRVAPVHGRASWIRHGGPPLLAGVPSPFRAGRYHSLAAVEVPAELAVDAEAEDGVVMAVSHRSRPMFGVQFHPESVLTEHGHAILANFLRFAPPAGPLRPAPSDRPVGLARTCTAP